MRARFKAGAEARYHVQAHSLIATCISGLLFMTLGGPGLGGEATLRPSYEPLPERAVGVLVPQASAVLGAEGRSGPTDAVLFSRNGKSYRWVYLPALEGEKGEAVTVQIGAGEERRFADTVLASEQALARRKASPGYSVVEVEVNGGAGSPPSDRFVATQLRFLDDSAEVPFRVDPLVTEALARCRMLPAETGAESTFESLRETTVGKEMPIVRQDQLVPRVTWLADKAEVQIDCRIELVGQESRRSAGTSPRQLAAPSESTAAYHGKRLSVSVGAEYRISPSGNLAEEARSTPKSAVTATPPRGGGAGPRQP
jgi:hypothetical protein